MSAPPTADRCRNCKHWTPRFRGIGSCEAAGLVHAPFWLHNTGEETELLTIESFSCQSWETSELTGKGTL